MRYNKVVTYYLQKEAGLFSGIASKTIGARLLELAKLLKKPKILIPAGLAAGTAAGAAGMYELENLGQQRLQAEQEAEELRRILEENPELLNAGLMPEE